MIDGQAVVSHLVELRAGDGLTFWVQNALGAGFVLEDTSVTLYKVAELD